MTSCLAICGLLVYDERNCRVREQMRDENVFRDRLRGEELWFLVDERDAVARRFLGRVDRDLLFVDEDLPLSGW